jgi:hypothetical protein
VCASDGADAQGSHRRADGRSLARYRHSKISEEQRAIHGSANKSIDRTHRLAQRLAAQCEPEAPSAQHCEVRCGRFDVDPFGVTP